MLKGEVAMVYTFELFIQLLRPESVYLKSFKSKQFITCHISLLNHLKIVKLLVLSPVISCQFHEKNMLNLLFQ